MAGKWFPEKVIRVWTQLHEFERVGLVLEHFLESGYFEDIQSFSSRNWPRPLTDRYAQRLSKADPIYAVSARRKTE